MVLLAELTMLMEDRGLPYSSVMNVKQMKNTLYTYDPGEWGKDSSSRKQIVGSTL